MLTPLGTYTKAIRRGRLRACEGAASAGDGIMDSRKGKPMATPMPFRAVRREIVKLIDFPPMLFCMQGRVSSHYMSTSFRGCQSGPAQQAAYFALRFWNGSLLT